MCVVVVLVDVGGVGLGEVIQGLLWSIACMGRLMVIDVDEDEISQGHNHQHTLVFLFLQQPTHHCCVPHETCFCNMFDNS